MITASFTVGRLLCGDVRDFLNKCKFKGMNIDFIESSGFMEREFTVKGDNHDVWTISRSIKAWAEENNLEE